MNTLIIEDDIVSREFLERAVSERGHQIKGCESGEQAQIHFLKHNYDLILLDLKLPHLGGLEFCRWLRSQPRGQTPIVIVITASDNIADLTRAMEAGANDFLAKPLDNALLNIRLTIAERQAADKKAKASAEANLRIAELRFSLFMDQLPGMAWIKEIDGQYIYCNTHFCKIAGKPLHELSGKTDAEIWGAVPAETFRQNDQRVISTRQPIEITEENHGPLGSRKWLVHKFPIDDQQGQLKWIGGLGIDMTESQKLAEENIKRSKLEAVGYLAGGIAHEFNNHLTVIMGNMSLVQLDLPPNAPAIEWLQSAQASAIRATQLSRELLAFAKGGDPIKQSSALESVVLSAMAIFPSNKISLNSPATLPSSLLDPQQITLLFRHLLENSFEASATQVQIRISEEDISEGHTCLAPGKYLRTVISDDGKGISAQILPRIFDPFFSTKGAGGLGLAIAYRIARKHKGSISAVNRSEGAEFVLHLPVEIVAQIPVQPKTSPETIQHPKARILIMDDDVEIVSLTSEILAREGYSVTSAYDGLEAINRYQEARASSDPFQAVIMDLTIPGGMGGKEAVRELISLDPNVKAIVCSGYSNDPVLANFSEYGFKAQISKPFTNAQLTSTLSSVLQSS